MNRPTLWLRVVLWLAVVGWAATIVFFSSVPGPQIEEIMPFQLWDKFLHFAAFTVGGLLLASALHATTAWTWGRTTVAGILILATFGAIDEWHQLHTPNRTGADVFDWLADALGSAVGAAICYIAAFLFGKRIATNAGAQEAAEAP